MPFYSVDCEAHSSMKGSFYNSYWRQEEVFQMDLSKGGLVSIYSESSLNAEVPENHNRVKHFRTEHFFL
jgi:hypothetical protein